jgi:hypothetical protein
MSMQAGLKAGAIGAGVLIVLALLSLIPIPFLSCFCCLLIFAAWVGAGLLAARYSPAPRAAGATAGAGAIAGAVSGLGYGVVTTIVSVIRAVMGGAAAAASQLPPQLLQQMQQSGMDPQTYQQIVGFVAAPGGAAVAGSLCCIGGLVLGAVLGAVGGAIGASVFKQA